MLKLVCWIAALLIVAFGVLVITRGFDLRADAKTRRALIATQPLAPPEYSSAMVAELPKVVRRYFDHAIAAGTPLFTVAQIKMDGDFSLGSSPDDPYMKMNADQVLGAPHGFVWSVTLRSDNMRLSGSDAFLNGDSWTRFWLLGTLPVARVGDTTNHARSAFGRYVAEAVFWTPAALLPGPDVTWDAIGENEARVTLRRGDLVQSVDLFINDAGAVTEVSFDRWSDANPDKMYRLQRFGGYLSDHRHFQGFTLPTRIDAGNHFGTAQYFPFYRAHVTGVDFPKPAK